MQECSKRLSLLPPTQLDRSMDRSIRSEILTGFWMFWVLDWKPV
jgi:hypothetical protein